MKADTSLKEIGLLFFKLGTTAFGGPAAHVAMMEDEVVRRRKWISREDFLDLLGATNFIPGPNSTEMAIHVGHKKAGWPGLIVAGVSFIIPAVLIVSLIAWAYVRYGNLPAVGAILYGVKPVIVAVVVQALWGLSRSALKNSLLAFVGVLSIFANVIGLNEIATVFLAGAFALTATKGLLLKQKRSIAKLLVTGSAVGISQTSLAAIAFVAPFSLNSLFWFFLKVGSVLFGSGYVLLAFLRADLVEKLGWLTESQLLDATAVGQFTPGPVFTTATFIGYVLSGAHGAIIATLGIFLPAFVFVALSAPFIPKLRQSQNMGIFLDGVNVGSLALMAVVTWHLGKSAVIDPLTIGIAAASAIALIRFRINSAWLVIAGGIIGVGNAFLL